MVSKKMIKEYSILASEFGFVQLAPRTLLRLEGADAATFLHSFCTADVKSMTMGDVREAFVLDSRGKSLAFGHILRIKDSYLYSVAFP